MQPIEFHYWPTPNGWKISMALEEMGLPYDLRLVNIGKGEQFTSEFRTLSPNGRMPAIVDPNVEGGLSIFESGAILQHLGRVSGQFYPQAVRERAEVEQWLFWQMGGLGPMAGQTHHFRQYARAVTQDQRHLVYGVTRYTNEVRRLYSVLERRLSDRDYVAGDYSIADMAIWPWIVPYKNQGQALERTPNLKAWFERVGAREAVKRGMAVGAELRNNLAASGAQAEQARKLLFGQRDA